MHGTELDRREWLAIQSNPLLREEHWPARVEPDQRGDQQQYWRAECQRQGGHNHVERTLERTVERVVERDILDAQQRQATDIANRNLVVGDQLECIWIKLDLDCFILGQR